MKRAAVIIALIVAGLVLPYRLSEAVRANLAREHDDFAVFYDTARCLFIESCDPYALHERRAPNLAPPHAHAFLLPVLWLPPGKAYWSWLGVSGLAIVASAALTWRVLAPISASMSLLALGVLLAAGSDLTTGLIASGQLYAVLALPVTGAWIAWRQSRRHLAAALIGAAASVKLLLLLPFAWFLLHRHFRAAGVMIGAFGVSMLAGLAWFGPRAYISWLDILAGADRSGHFRDGSIFTAIGRAVLPNNYFSSFAGTEWLLIPLWAVATGIIVAVTMIRSTDADRTWLSLIAAALLVSPKGWNYAGWWLLFPALAVAKNGGRLCRGLLIVAAALLWLPDGAPRWGQPSPLLTATWGALYAWTWLAVWLAAGTTPRCDDLVAARRVGR